MASAVPGLRTSCYTGREGSDSRFKLSVPKVTAAAANEAAAAGFAAP